MFGPAPPSAPICFSDKGRRRSKSSRTPSLLGVTRPLLRWNLPESAGTPISIWGLSNAVALFIILTTAAALRKYGVTNIQTLSQAAEVLRPTAGAFVFLVFAMGIIGTGMLAVPVLAGLAANALGETFGWHVGLARKLNQAKGFYATIMVAKVVGIDLNFTPIDPVKALF